MKSSEHGTRRTRRRWWIWPLATLLLIALLVRFTLPYFLRSQANVRLAAMKGFHGHVEDLDLALWRGAYRFEGLTLERRVDGEREPFLEADVIDFSLAWSALLKGRMRSEIEARKVTLVYVPVDREAASADLDEPDWRDVVTALFPIEIRRVEVHEGRVEYLDTESNPPVDASLRDLSVTVTGLSNEYDPAQEDRLPAHLTAHGSTVGGGEVQIEGRAAPLARAPLFDLDLTIEGVELRDLNDYLRAAFGLDVSEGTLQLYFELTARGGGYEGYLKPLFDHLDFSAVEGREDGEGPGSALWEGFVSIVVELFENQPRDQAGTRIPIAGEFGEANLDLFTALGTFFRHGLIEALSEDLEGISLEDRSPAEEAEDEPAPSPTSPREPAGPPSKVKGGHAGEGTTRSP
ncbi:MAG: DUF748 domain-containing protein [Verrucomicrobiota bacterium]